MNAREIGQEIVAEFAGIGIDCEMYTKAILQAAADAIAHGCPDVADALIDMATEEDG